MKPFGLFPCILLHSLIPVMSLSATPVSYKTPPAYLQRIEGEDAFEHNWTPGESRHFWYKKDANVTGRGVLDLAASSLPEAGAFTAKYRFEVPEDGTYTIYARTRFPGFLGSPFYWRIDEGSETRQPKDDAHSEDNIVDAIINHKMALVRLGPFEVAKGGHTLTISVRDFVNDGLPYISQMIDSLYVATSRVEPFPQTLAVSPGGVVLNANVDPKNEDFPGIEIPTTAGDWSHFKTLVVPLTVNSRSSEDFQGRLRVYLPDASFKDLIISVPAAQFGASSEFTFSLAEAMPESWNGKVSALRIFTHDKWYSSSRAFAVSVGPLALTDQMESAPATIVIDPTEGTEASQNSEASGLSGDFVWNDVSNTGANPKHQGEVTEKTVYVAHADGVERSPSVEFLSPPMGADQSQLGLRRTQFKVTNQSQSDIFRVDFAFEKAPHVNKGEFFAGSRRYDVATMPPSGALLGPSKFTHDWVCLAANGKTIFTYLEDSSHQDSCLHFAAGTGGGVDWNFSKFVRIKPGETWVSPVIVRGLRDGENWHESADLFYSWWSSWAKRPLIPKWFKSIGGMMVGLNYPINGRAADLETLEARRKQAEGKAAANRELITGGRESLGLDWWHSGLWLPLGTEAWYPNGYILNDRQAAELRTLTDDARSAGGRTSFYTNPLMLSRVAPEYPDLMTRGLVMDLDGFPVFTEHTFRHHPMAIMAADAEWGKKFADIILPVIRDVRPDALYMDQLGAVPIHLDWTQDLPMSRLGLWCYNQGLFCEAVLDSLHKVDPELVTGIEGVNVYAQQFVTYALLFDGDYEVLKYTFPNFVTMVGQYEEVDGARLVRNARMALLTGQPLILINDFAKISPEIASQVSAIIRLKRELDPALYGLRYRHTEKLRLDDGLLAASFSGSHNDRIVVAANNGAEAKTFSVGQGSIEVGRSWNSEHIQLTGENTFTVQPDSIAAVEVFLK